MNKLLKDDIEFYSELLRAFLHSADDAIFVLCDEMKFLLCNRVTEDWLGLSEEFLTAHNKRIPFTHFLSEKNNIALFEKYFSEAVSGNSAQFECQLRSEAGKIRWIEFRMKKVTVIDAEMVIVVGRDINDKKQIQDEILFETSHDHLTHLYNREFFINFVQSRIHSSKKGERFSVIILNINKFRIYNEVLGHRLADKILIHTAETLRRRLPAKSYLSRYGSNEFAFICGEFERSAIIDYVIEVLSDFEAPVLVDSSDNNHAPDINNIPVVLDFTAGISVYPDHGEMVDLLALRAELALKNAKKNQNVFSIFEFDEDSKQRMNELEFMGDFKKALSEDQFLIYFQPKVRLSDLKVVGSEILSRWNHPERGVLSPDSFLPMAEEMNLFRAFSRLLINKSFSMIHELSVSHRIHYAINISPYNLLESDFVEFMKNSLKSYRIRAENVTLEITETGMMLDRDLSHKIMNDLAGLGFSIAVDDFGTGYTSLSYLQGLPLHELKIDRTFVKNIHENYNNSVIVKSLILLGQSLGMYITAEGVENEAEIDILKKYGCNLVQGFYFSKPLTFDKFKEYLSEQGV